ncbi:MAG: hypothetical protein ACM3SQ_09120 [Betaproteobacteria bacterium]
MYLAILTVHSWVRWGALLLGIVATGAAVTDRPGAPAGRADRWGLFLMITLDVQMLLGLLLYLVLSPFTRLAFADFGAAMRDPALRYWAVEHISTMILAVIVVHVTRVAARAAATPSGRRTRQILGFGVATILMLVGTPWAGLPNGRPLFRI